MNNKLNILFSSIVLLTLSMWGVSILLTIQDLTVQLSLVGVMLVTIFTITIKPSLPIDFKCLLFVLIGYFFAGKGFAYLSPTPGLPIYVGELFLVVLMVGFTIRSKLNIVESCRLHVLNVFILVACCYVLLRLVLIDFDMYGLLAIRDSAMVYYSFIAIATAKLMADEKLMNVMKKVICPIVLVGVVSHAVLVKCVYASSLADIPLVKAVYLPHPDIHVGLNAACAVIGFHLLEKKSYWGILFLVTTLITMATGKTAYTFAFVIVALVFLIYGRMKIVLILGGAIAFFAIFVGAVLVSVDSDRLEILEQSDLSTTFDDIGQSGYVGTSGWRLNWWRIVFRDTYNEAPIFGLGLGSDISTNFIEEGMGIDVDTSDHQMLLTRYPHNIFFTVFGRLGFVGATFLILYSIFFLRFIYKYCKLLIAKNERELIDIILLAIVLAGFCNAFVQTTYENPYAGIPHWICMGIMFARYSIGEREAFDVKKIK